MTILTLLLIGIFFAAWKAPAWVKHIGHAALGFSFLVLFVSLWQIFNLAESFGDIAFPVLCGGMKCALISPIYGLSIYLVSVVIRVIQTPRI